MKESYEEMLFKYGVSCIENLRYLRRISMEDYQRFVTCAENGEVPDREFIERVLSEAVKRIGQDKTAQAVDDYFRRRHNALIDRREGNYGRLPLTLCEACKVHEGRVVEIKTIEGIPIYTIETGSGREFAVGKYLKNARLGDNIVTHNHLAIRVL